MTEAFPTSRATFLWRGITHSCPRCGCRKTHTKYFSAQTTCPQCSLKFEKEAGYWTGAIAINIIITGGLVVLALAIGLISTAPDIPVVPLIALILPIGIFMPIILYPISQTMWMAIDYGFMSRLD